MPSGVRPATGSNPTNTSKMAGMATVRPMATTSLATDEAGPQVAEDRAARARGPARARAGTPTRPAPADDRPAPLRAGLEVHGRRHVGLGAEGEVEDAARLVGEHEAEGDERVDRAGRRALEERPEQVLADRGGCEGHRDGVPARSAEVGVVGLRPGEVGLVPAEPRLVGRATVANSPPSTFTRAVHSAPRPRSRVSCVKVAWALVQSIGSRMPPASKAVMALVAAVTVSRSNSGPRPAGPRRRAWR